MEREGGAVALLVDFEIVEEPTDIGEEEVADLRLLVERGLNLRKGVFQVPMLVGEISRNGNLRTLAARRLSVRGAEVVSISAA